MVGKPLGERPMTPAERQKKHREKLKLRGTKTELPGNVTKSPLTTLTALPPEALVMPMLEKGGSAYCRELARCLLLTAVWHDAGRPPDWAQRHADIVRHVSVLAQLRV